MSILCCATVYLWCLCEFWDVQFEFVLQQFLKVLIDYCEVYMSLCVYVCVYRCEHLYVFFKCFVASTYIVEKCKLYRLFIYIFMFLYIHLSDTFSIFHSFYYFKFSLQICFFSRYLQIYCHKARGMTNSISYKFTFLFLVLPQSTNTKYPKRMVDR